MKRYQKVNKIKTCFYTNQRYTKGDILQWVVSSTIKVISTQTRIKSTKTLMWGFTERFGLFFIPTSYNELVTQFEVIHEHQLIVAVFACGTCV